MPPEAAGPTAPAGGRPPAVGFFGDSGAGKTTLIERLIARFRGQGLRIAAIKHAHHGFDLDRPGKDSYRLREAGAAQVLLVADERWALLSEERAGGPAEDLARHLERLAPCDLVLVEGFRASGSIPFLHVLGASALAGSTAPCVAVVGTGGVSWAGDVPYFDRDDIGALAAFVGSLAGFAANARHAPAPAGEGPGEILVDFEQARARLLAAAGAPAASESVDLASALGRVLAQDLVAGFDVPAWDSSLRDGYAVRCADCAQPPARLPVSLRVAAGQAAPPLPAGEAARIFTGAPIPGGCDAVVMQEQADALPDAVELRARPVPGQWIRRAGSDMRQGSCAIAQGTVLGPAHLGVAASLGVRGVAVFRRPRVALLSTGDELLEPGAEPAPGKIFDSNRPLLGALLLRLGCEPWDLGAIPDSRERIVQALARAAQGSELVLASGGVSVGEADHVRAALASLGRVDMWRIAMKPGKPLAFGAVQGVPFIGLPGNPVSALVGFALLVRPFLLRRMGAALPAGACAPGYLLPAAFTYRADALRREFLRARVTAEGTVALLAEQGAADLRAASAAHGLVELAPGALVRPGDPVRLLPWTQLLSPDVGV